MSTDTQGKSADTLIVGDSWKDELSNDDRDLANEVESKLAEVQKQMKLIEEKQAKIQNSMGFPFGFGKPKGLPNMGSMMGGGMQEGANNSNDSNDKQNFDQMTPKISASEIPISDARGNLITDVDIAVENYNKSYPFIRCLKLPFCATQIKKKLYFWSFASLGLGVSYEAFGKICKFFHS